MAVREDLLERGFQLAYFVFPSRTVAIRILSGALNKLKAQRGRENRRAYWRDKYLKRGITRISRDEQDALQWLIFFESDGFEREQEKNGGSAPEEMAVRYIKNLVRMTTAMSSFYVNVGVHRLLYNYTTAEAQTVYETITQRYLGADEYRRAKGVLMGKMERRFGKFLRICRTQHGELRFEACPDQAQWAGLADACLQAFTPWSTKERCPIPSTYGSKRDTLSPQLSGAAPEAPNHDQVEIYRCHAFIDPTCYARLARALAFDPPERKLALPRFFMEDTGNKKHPDPSQQAPPLTPEERRLVSSRVGAEATRRRKADAHFVTVVVDGSERAELTLSGDTEHVFEIEDGAELLEIRTVDQGRDLLLATHRVAYGESRGIAPSSTTVFLKGRRKLRLEISPGAPGRALVKLRYTPPALGAWLDQPLWNWGRYALAASALLAAGWLVGAATGGVRWLPKSQSRGSMQQPADRLREGSTLTLVSDEPAVGGKLREVVPTYTLVPDDSIVRSPGGAQVPSVVVPSRPVLLRLELPVAPAEATQSLRATLRPFFQQTYLLSQSLRRAKSSTGTVAFWVPSTVLDDNQDYAVDLRLRNSSGGLDEVNSYTFRTVAEHN